MAEHIAARVAQHLVEPQGIGRLARGDKALAVTAVGVALQGLRAFVHAEEFAVAVDQGVDKQAVAEDPLLIAPIAGGLLADEFAEPLVGSISTTAFVAATDTFSAEVTCTLAAGVAPSTLVDWDVLVVNARTN